MICGIVQRTPEDPPKAVARGINNRSVNPDEVVSSLFQYLLQIKVDDFIVPYIYVNWRLYLFYESYKLNYH